MLDNLYFLIKGHYSDDCEKHIGYGIGCIDKGEVLAFEDVSTNYVKMAELVSLCNSLKLSPIHLSDVVSDFIAELT